jgi:Flp pilus assembly protein TadG
MRQCGRFFTAQSGAAAVEFALVLPLMLLLYIGSTELSQVITVDRRVTTIAGTVGDLVSRSNTTVTATELTDYFTAASSIITPFTTTGLQQVVSELAVDTQGKATVVWSRATNGGVAHAATSAFSLTDVPEMANLAKGKFLIVAETSYSYTPMLDFFFKKSFSLYHRNYYLPRFGGSISYCATCT